MVGAIGLAGSSKVTRLLLPDGPLSDIVFLLSLFSFFATCKVSSVAGVLVRPGIIILVFFFAGGVALTSRVGAVVMISGAGRPLVSRVSRKAGGTT